MNCHVTGKISFDSEVIAEEALLSHHARQFHQPGQGPTNIYQCDHCSCWHFTSKGEVHSALQSDDSRARLERERLGTHWERKLR